MDDRKCKLNCPEGCENCHFNEEIQELECDECSDEWREEWYDHFGHSLRNCK